MQEGAYLVETHFGPNFNMQNSLKTNIILKYNHQIYIAIVPSDTKIGIPSIQVSIIDKSIIECHN